MRGKRGGGLVNRSDSSQDFDLSVVASSHHDDDDDLPLIETGDPSKPVVSIDSLSDSKLNVVSKAGLYVLLLLALHNCFHTLLMRFVMKDRPKFLKSAAVLGTEVLKLAASVFYIVVIERKSPYSIVQYLREDSRNTMLLIFPASAYNLQRSLEYVALQNLPAPIFSVLVQSKLFFTATFAMAVLQTRLKIVQVISLILLTVGVMLCNLSKATDKTAVDQGDGEMIKGVAATLGIAVSSGFASVYTEKVIKAQRGRTVMDSDQYGLAYTQVQLALMSFAVIGVYAVLTDRSAIVKHGLFHNFTPGAFVSIVDSAVGGLIVAAVLKYADSVLKGYATAISVVLTGFLSIFLFGTNLTTVYFLGIINVVIAVVLYNGKNLDQTVGCGPAK